MHGQATRTNRRAMEAVGAFSSASEAGYGATLGRPPQNHQWYFVEAQDRGALAGSSRAVRALEHGVQPIFQVEEARHLGSDIFCSYCQGRCKGICELGDSSDRQHDHPGTPTCCRVKKGGPQEEALGYSQGGFSTKVHVRTDGNGKLIALALTPGQRHETIAFHELMRTGAIKRLKQGRPKNRPHRLIGDKAYSSDEIREYLRNRHIRITIPRRINETRTGKFDKIIYRLRNRIERFINRMKHFRSLATRYDKSASSYRTLWIIGSMLLWLQ